MILALVTNDQCDTCIHLQLSAVEGFGMQALQMHPRVLIAAIQRMRVCGSTILVASIQ
jgi:hypothetical protein